VPLPILGEADEIFQGRKPCLTLVDGRSFLVLNLAPAESHDGTTWGLTYLDLVERGIRFQDLACDGGTGLRAGVRETPLAIPLRPDLFHIQQEAYRLTRRLEQRAPTRPLRRPNAPAEPNWKPRASSADGDLVSRSRCLCLKSRLKKPRPSRPLTPGVGCSVKSAQPWNPSHQTAVSCPWRRPRLRWRRR
jgi:hypothetical protein